MFHVIIYYRPVAVLTWYRFSTIEIFKEVLYCIWYCIKNNTFILDVDIPATEWGWLMIIASP